MSKVMVVPCSGIGKAPGLIARETALQVTGNIAPDLCEIACLGYLVTGDERAKLRIAGMPCLTIDGCTAYCAATSVADIGGDVREKYLVLDELRLHRGLNPGDASTLSEEGWEIVDGFAEKVAEKARAIVGGERDG